jgi:hypothetical protein
VRRAAKRDANEAAIVDALERVGCSVARLNDPGVPDLLVARHGSMWLLEVKMPAGSKGGTAGRELTPEQRRWWASWRGPQPHVVRSIEEALTVVGVNVNNAAVRGGAVL